MFLFLEKCEMLLVLVDVELMFHGSPGLRLSFHVKLSWDERNITGQNASGSKRGGNLVVMLFSHIINIFIMSF